MRFTVIGSGAIGGAIGAQLVRSGHDVLFCDRDVEHVAAMSRKGLRIEGPVAQFTVRVPAVLPTQLPDDLGIVLLAVKAHHTSAAMAAVAGRLGRDGVVLSLQNGFTASAIARVVGAERVLVGFVNFGADLLAPGRILQGNVATFRIGEPGGPASARVRELADVLPWAQATDNIAGYLWSKEAYGAMLFATALTNESIADALADPRYRDLYIALAREILAVAEARGVSPAGFDGFDPASYLPSAPKGAAERSLDQLVAHNRKSVKTHSGIWRDLAVRKRRTEVDAQLGIIVALGDEAGVSAPLTAKLVELIHDIENGVRAQSLETLDALAAVIPNAARE